MIFHVITNVWGDWHVDLFLRLTLPNVLSAGNLPAMAEFGDVVYRVFTTPAAAERIRDAPSFRRLESIARVEFVTPLGARSPDVAYHVHWFHRSAAEAKRDGAVAVFVPPDTLWTDGTFRRFAELMAEGKKGVACPFLQVVGDTCVPEARGRFLDPDGAVMTLPPREVWSLARRHLHPLQALAIPGGRHARPAFELHWPVPGEGIVSCYAARELVAFDPRRCPITYLWYAAGPEDEAGLHFGRDSDEMFMLSVDPIEKYLINYIIGHACQPFDLARTTLHPLNDTRQTRVFLRRPVSVHGEARTPRRWRRRELLALAGARDALVGRRAMQLCKAMTERGCAKAAGLLSVALLATPLARHWREGEPLTVVAPTDAALAALPSDALGRLMSAGQERRLQRVVRDHVVAGDLAPGAACRTLAGTPLRLERRGGGATVNGLPVTAGPEALEGTTLYAVDGIVAASLAGSAAG